MLGELRLDLIGIRIRAIDLVQRDDDGNLGRLDVGDRFDRLGLNAIIRGDHEHGNIRDLRAPGAHCGEGLMSGRVQECDLAAVVLDLIGADVLRDATRLACRDVRRADRVQQTGLAVIDVSEDRYDGWPCPELRRIFVLPQDLFCTDELGLGLLFDDRLSLFLGACLDPELVGNECRRLEVDGLIDRDHHAHVHQSTDDVDHADVERARKVADDDRLRQRDHGPRLGDGDGRGGLGRGWRRLRTLRPAPFGARPALRRHPSRPCFRH